MIVKEALTRKTWRLAANCAGLPTEMFFTDTASHRNDIMFACAACPVRDWCSVAGVNEEFGVFGGASAEKRKRLRRGFGIDGPGLTQSEAMRLDKVQRIQNAGYEILEGADPDTAVRRNRVDLQAMIRLMANHIPPRVWGQAVKKGFARDLIVERKARTRRALGL